MSTKKSELVEKLANNYPSFYKKDLKRLVEIFFLELKSALKRHERVELRDIFTLETKLAKVNSVNFRPHQIAWHCRHPVNAFILLFSQRHRTAKLFKSTSIHDLRKQGHQAPNHVALSFDEINRYLMSL